MDANPSQPTQPGFDSILEEGADDISALEEDFGYFIAPKSLIWELTGRCSMRCPFCSGSFPRRIENELSRDEKLALAAELASNHLFGINLSGGEPLLCNELPEIIEIFRKGNIPVMVVTSGTGLTEDLVVNALKHPELGFCFSLDSHIKEIHDELRGTEGAFDQVVAGIKMFAEIAGSKKGDPKSRVSLLVECVVTSRNIDSIEETIEFCEKIGVVHMRIQSMVAVGRGAENKQLSLTEEQKSELKRRVLQARDKINAAVSEGKRAATFQVNFVDQSTHIKHGLRTGRNTGGIICPDGTLKPSAYLPYSFGSIRDKGDFMSCWNQGFKAVWRHPHLVKSLANIASITDLETTIFEQSGEIELSLNEIKL